MELNELFDYKNLLMKNLCCNEKIVKLITDKENCRVPNHTLAYSQIFPFEFIPETVDNGQTFICFDIDIVSVQNKTFYTPVLYIWIFTHKSKLRMQAGGIRTDALAVEINKVLNGNRFYGLGEMDLKNVTRFSPINDYQGRVLTYNARDFNRSISQPAPSNRMDRNR